MSVRVAGVPYQIRLAKVLLSSELNGETLLSECVVHIRQDLPPAKQEQTFWHELFHIILEGENTGSDTPANEEYVTRISNLLYGVLMDNGYLTEGWFDKTIDDRGGK